MRSLLLPFLLAGVLFGQDAKKELPALTAAEFDARRDRLMKAFPDGVVVVDTGVLLPGAAGIDLNTPVFDFSYLTGFHDDKGVLVLIPAEGKTFLFISGDCKAAQKRTGLEHVLPRDRLEAFAEEVLSGANTFHTKVREPVKRLLRKVAPKADIRGDAGRAIVELRLVKSDAELRLIRKASDATNKAHVAAMKACKPGMNEGELQKLVEATFKAEDCHELAFPSIVGSGRNGTILHYMENHDPMPAESLVVCDIGAGYLGYATDITRTLPTSGRYTAAQRKAYQCVLDAQRAAEEALKPGANFGDLDRLAMKVFKDRQMTDWCYGNTKERSVNHLLGHFVGLAVHDSGGYEVRFEPGMVVTIEPGYYSKKEGWGVRIEDIYLVTEDGFERLSAGAPREIDEIEALMKK